MITRAKVRDGVIVSEIVSFDPNTTDARDWRVALESMAVFQSARQRIEAHRVKAQQVIDQGATGRRLNCAKTAARMLNDAVGMLERKDAEGAVCNVIRAMECLWVVDVKQVEPEIITGAKSRKGAGKGRESIKNAASTKNKMLQLKAKEIWARRPALSERSVAKLIDPHKWDSIRHVIKKPSK